MQQVHDEMVAEAPPEAPRKSSGYRRLQVRHRNLLAEHEVLKADLAERDQIEVRVAGVNRPPAGAAQKDHAGTILIGLPCKR